LILVSVADTETRFWSYTTSRSRMANSSHPPTGC
jgi:hypothetical protein